MVKALSYTTISHIIESWELIRQTKDYEKTVGTYLFQYLFKRCPDAKVLFGFHIDVDTDSPKLLESKRFLTHAKYLVQMLDTAFNVSVFLFTRWSLPIGNPPKSQRCFFALKDVGSR
mmetsp:Transcript_6296/g.14041  ORF Transcript_6296/g.14041 Transcript_6296/m.14041 type:complete len:117 (-) Transcript_6296:30-380(-)